MAEDWSIDVKKYVPDADDGIIAGIVRYCGIALQKRDSSLVSFGDAKETDRVRENFLKKKLALTSSDDDLNQAIAAVGERMKGENFKNRVTVYYLLADHFGVLNLFAKAGSAVAGGAAAAGAGAAAVAGLASLGGKDDAEPVAAPALEPVAAAPVAAAAAGGAAAAASSVGGGAQALTGDSYGAADASDTSGGLGWLKWLLLALAALLLLWWLFFRQPQAAAPTAEPAPAETAAAVAPAATEAAAPAPAEGTVAIPTGAGVTTETRDGKPVVKVYFDTGKTTIVDAFAPAAGALKAWLDSHAGSKLGISGYNDKTGNAAANAELSKNRAKAVKAALVAAGVPDAAAELVKPAETTDTKTDEAGARRVEVFVQ